MSIMDGRRGPSLGVREGAKMRFAFQRGDRVAMLPSFQFARFYCSVPLGSIGSSSVSVKPPRCHPHMLRHACGFKLANDGHDTRALQHYLGHKNIQHTVRYTELSPTGSRTFGGT